MNGIQIDTKYLEQFVKSLDSHFENRLVSCGEYIQIGLLLKMLQTLDEIKKKLGVRLEN